jgi:hypothetical protein
MCAPTLMKVDIPRFQLGRPAVVSPRGAAAMQIPATFVRVEPLVIPKKSLTGASTDRVDTRVLQVIYAISDHLSGLYPGQQVDLFIEAGSSKREPELATGSGRQMGFLEARRSFRRGNGVKDASFRRRQQVV